MYTIIKFFASLLIGITSLFVHHAIPVQPTAISTAVTDTSSVVQSASVVSAPKTVSVPREVPDKDPSVIPAIVAAPVAPPETAVTTSVAPATVPVVNHTGMLECNDEWIPDCSSGSELVCPNSGSGYCELKSQVEAENTTVVPTIDPNTNTVISLLMSYCNPSTPPVRSPDLVITECDTAATKLLPYIQEENLPSPKNASLPDWGTSQLSKVQSVHSSVNQMYLSYQKTNLNSDPAIYAGYMVEYQQELADLTKDVNAF